MKQILPVCLLLLIATFAFAQVEEITATVNPVSCGACFLSAQASIKQLNGVSDVQADIQKGTITVKAKRDISVKAVMDRLRAAGLGSGVSVEIQATGKLETRGNRTVLVIPQQGETFIVETGDKQAQAKKMTDESASVRIEGLLESSGSNFRIRVKKLQKAN